MPSTGKGRGAAPTPVLARREKAVAGIQRIIASERVAVADLTLAVNDVFLAAGLSRADAGLAAEGATYATARGIFSHGVAHLPLYVSGLLDGTIKSKPKMKLSGGLAASKVLDASHGLGLVVGRHALNTAMELAVEFGVGAVAVRNSSHFGAAGHYAELAAKHNLISMIFCNAAPAQAPSGGADPILGTNPIAFGMPLAGEDPIVLDMATTVVARSRVRDAQAKGKDIPMDWALDENGQPTADPAAALRGSMMPVGGPKGYGLALVAELLGSALSDGAPGFDITYEDIVRQPSRISHFFLAINPGGFAGDEAYGDRAGHITRKIRNSRPSVEGVPPRLPGGRGLAALRKHGETGIPMADNIRVPLNKVAQLLTSDRGLA